LRSQANAAKNETGSRHPLARPSLGITLDRQTTLPDQDTLRATRLEQEFLQAEKQLDTFGIDHAIVVFGSTRVTEPSAARATVNRLQESLGNDPDNSAIANRLKVAQRLLKNSRYYDMARQFGGIVARQKDRLAGRLVIMTGGGPGIMEAANRGASEAGGRTAGLNINLPDKQQPNPYITPGLCISFRYFAIRKLHFILRARALVVFPGGYGTLDELFETLNLIQTAKIDPVPVILVGRDFWKSVLDFDLLVSEGMIGANDHKLLVYAETADEIWSGILDWYAQRKRTLAD
jgi:uncharacterized protein (TIGR00730 family)